MKRLFPLLLLLISCSKEIIPTVEEIDLYVDCRPQSAVLDNSKADAVTGLIEFDIFPDMNFGSKGAVLTAEERLWPNATVPYFIQPTRPHSSGTGIVLGFDNEEDKDKIRAALIELSKQTGLQFPEYENKEELLKDYPNGVRVEPGFGSSGSFKGRQKGIQAIQLVFSLNPGTIKHEFLHAVGFGHEFTRSDRDEHLIIHWDNMLERWHRQFDVDPLATDCGPFDIESIMMYGSYQITLDAPQITTIDGEVFERKQDLSPGDIATVKAMYNLN